MITLSEQVDPIHVSAATLDKCEQLFKCSFEQAAQSASLLVNRQMIIDQIQIQVRSGDSFMNQVEDEFETCYFASIIKTMNEMDINILFLISEREGIGLYNSLTGLSHSANTMVTADMISAVGELNNILGCSLINCIANRLKTAIHATPPYSTFDMLGAVMQCIVLQDQFVNREFFCADATIRENEKNGFLVRMIIMSRKDLFIDLANQI